MRFRKTGFQTWLGYRKQEQYREVSLLIVGGLVNLSYFYKPNPQEISGAVLSPIAELRVVASLPPSGSHL